MPVLVRDTPTGLLAGNPLCRRYMLSTAIDPTARRPAHRVPKARELLLVGGR